MIKSAAFAVFMCWGGYAYITYVNTGDAPFETEQWGPGCTMLVSLGVMFAMLLYFTLSKAKDNEEAEKMKANYRELTQSARV